MPNSLRVRDRRRAQPTASPAALTAAAESISAQPRFVCEPIDNLKPARNRIRKHPRRQIEILLRNIRRFGVVVPVLITRDREIIDGHLIWETCKQLGHKTIPVMVVAHLSEAEVKALRISISAISEMSEWDDLALALELDFVCRVDPLLWLRFYMEQPSAFERIVVSWDTASTLQETSDYSVGTVWGSVGMDFYLLDVVRGRFESSDLRRKIMDVSSQWQADVTIVENTELGRALVQDLRVAGELRPILQTPSFDKEARLLAQAARFETGQVNLPTDAPWLADYVGELTAFPNGRHDDQVDATSQALRYLTRDAHIRKPPQRRPTAERRRIRERS